MCCELHEWWVAEILSKTPLPLNRSSLLSLRALSDGSRSPQQILTMRRHARISLTRSMPNTR